MHRVPGYFPVNSSSAIYAGDGMWGTRASQGISFPVDNISSDPTNPVLIYDYHAHHGCLHAVKATALPVFNGS
jgi:hypothetical protein